MSDEARKAQSEKMKAYWAAKKGEPARVAPDLGPSPDEHFDTQVEPGPEPGASPSADNADIGDLLRRIKELEDDRQFMRTGMSQNAGVQANARGGLVGTFEKYAVNPAHYPDPCARLAQEPRLQRFAFPANYELVFEVATTSYQTKDGVNTREPKFTLELNRIVYDEDSGAPTNGRYVVCRAIFHEDPDAALVVAHDNGIDVDSMNEKRFLDEMRYLRMRDWLLEAFYPPKSQQKRSKKEMVIGNRLVEYFEVNSQDSEMIPFDQLKNKV